MKIIIKTLPFFTHERLLNHVSPFTYCRKTMCDSLDFFCRPKTSVAVSSVLLGLVLAGRAAFVFPLSFLSNLTKKTQSEKISFREQVWLDFCKYSLSGFLGLSGYVDKFFILGDNLVGWSYERCCFNGTCLQSGKSNMWHVGAV